jgi:hypothetical protein
VKKGGKVVSFFSGSTAQRLTSRQIAEEMLNCGAEVNVVNRKRLLHAKCYGWESSQGNSLIVSSGNFTGPGMSQNVEASLLLQPDHTHQIGFKWHDVAASLRKQRWDFHRLDLAKRTAPGWQLFYDEYAGDIRLDETEEVTMLLTLSHADTARIQEVPALRWQRHTIFLVEQRLLRLFSAAHNSQPPWYEKHLLVRRKHELR